MPHAENSFPSLPSADWAKVERLVGQFEDAWRRGERPALEDFLPTDDTLRTAALLELAHTDLEYRLNRDEAARVEEYLSRFPALAGDRTAVLSLLAAEEKLLRQKGQSPPLEDYLRRFPDYREELAVRLGSNGRTPEAADPDTRVLTESAAAPETLAPPARGTPGLPSIAGYVILRELGRGGMGIVYEAEHQRLGRRVALKTLRAAADAETLERFRFEAEAVARLQHPNVVQVHEIGEHQGVPYFSLELVEGGTLAQRLAGAPLKPRDAAQLVEVLARAVQAAHSRGVLHRDLKPANVLLTADGTPKVADFGLAKRLGADAARTHTGAVVGTPSYMAPEQAFGHGHAVGPHTDVYALGGILYECLTGQPPFRAATLLATLDLVRTREPVPPHRLNAAIPRDLETICLKALAKEPGRRYGSALALAEDLRRFLDGEPITARPVGRGERLRLWARRRPALAAAYALVLLAVVLGAAAVGVTWLWRLAELARADAVQAKNDLSGALQREQTANQATDELAKQLEQAKYLRNVDLAYRAYGENSAARAEQLLQECPERLRGWEWRLVQRLCRSTTVLDVPHSADTRLLVFSADGRRVAGARADQTVTVWDAETGRETGSLARLPANASGLAFTADGRRLIVLCGNGGETTVLEYDLSTSKPIRTTQGPKMEANGKSVAQGSLLCPDGSRAATVAEDHTVTIWDTATGKTLGTFKDAAYGIIYPVETLSLCWFSPDGKRIASAFSASGNSGLRVWDVDTGQLILNRPQADPRVSWVNFNPDGKTLAVLLNGDTTVHLWDIATGREVQTLAGHFRLVSTAYFSRDGRRLASSSVDMTMKVWDVQAGREIATLPARTTDMVGLAFSPDGRRLATASRQGVQLWDAQHEPGRLLLAGNWGRDPSALRFSPDGQRLTFFASDHRARTWDVENGVVSFPVKHALGSPVGGASLSPDGSRLVVAANGGGQVCDLQTGQVVALAKLPQEPPTATRVVATSVNWEAAAFSPDNRTVAAGCLTSVTEIVDPKRGATRNTAQGGKIAVWDAQTGNTMRTLDGLKGEVWSLAFSPDGRHLVSGSRDGTLAVWDARTGERERTLHEHTDTIWGMAFSADGKLLATAALDWTVKVWDTATWQVVHTLRGHTNYVYGVSFSPDGRRLASCSADRTIKLWDVATGQECLTLPGHDDFVTAVRFSPDGRRLASRSDKLLMVWDAGP